MMLRLFCLQLMFCLVTTLVCAGDMVSDRDQAHQLFAEKKYIESAAAWTKVALSHPAANAYYNAGLAFAHAGDKVRSVYALEQASRFSPSDREIKDLLSQLRSQDAEAVIAIKPFFLSVFFRNIISGLRPGWWALLGLLIFALVVYDVLGKWKVWGAKCLLPTRLTIICIVLGVSFLVAGLFRYHQMYRTDEGVLSVRSDMHQAADAGSPVLYAVPDGEKVILHDSIREWYYVSLANLDYGWLPKENVMKIYVDR